ncbi:MMPL family transporter [Allorhodopirellula solitaria]|uniref:Putative membrane protein YdgH n=1 Tax=Allorhodopirellula solitaria TaxID=2527987 RepID=A0A5C5XZ52_9BACT|nr:MMPL family transporter [Allorhodopirellula solitaria]TWT67563.1 putative membrane protein YdgH [Allorhodopirellula solitaria]
MKAKSLPARFAHGVIKHAGVILIAWLVAAVLAKGLAPSWKSVALDGDFDYLPASQVSVAGGRLLDQAFMGTRARSQMVLVFAKDGEGFSTSDHLLGLDILRRLYHRLGEVCWQRAERIAGGDVDSANILVPQPDGLPSALGEANALGGTSALGETSALGKTSDGQRPSPAAVNREVPDDGAAAERERDDQEAHPRPPGNDGLATALSAQRWLGVAVAAFDQAIEIDADFYKLLGDRVPQRQPTAYQPRLAIAYWDRGHLAQARGPDPTLVEEDIASAKVLDPSIEATASPITERDLEVWESLLDVYSWKESEIGPQLRRGHARIAVLSLANELAATGNIELLTQLRQIVDECVQYRRDYLSDDELTLARELEVRITGSAAIGGETLLAARSAISYTEWFTVVMILIILAIVYRAPLLVAVPLVTIAVAVMVATGLVTALTQLSAHAQWPGLDLKVYTTSRIFVVVILFGAGTDYCLFLISRLREEAVNHAWPIACERALRSVSSALLGSAMTTIVGLGMLWFADFGKFHHTGPIIAICLSVGLLVCMTLTPACLRLIGPVVFWPTRITSEMGPSAISLLSNRNLTEVDSRGARSASSARLSSGSRAWNAASIALTRYPIWTLAAGWLMLILPAIEGRRHEQDVTYDLSGQLPQSAGSRQGMRILDKNFGVGELAPISVLTLAESDQNEESLAATRLLLTDALYDVDGVRRVRSLSDPLGDFPPDREMGLLSKEAWRRRALQNHRLARMHFVANEPSFTHRLIRLDVIVREDPFSQAAAQKLEEIATKVRGVLAERQRDTDTAWELFYTGTTASIVDLREVTLRDTGRIKMAVILAVLAVLIFVLRRVVLSVYLIATVLLSYYATLGLTYWFFRTLDGPDFLGLDWKLPLFLFVILVAVGQDYNVYLVTRIIEERRRLGSLAAVRRAVARTGGIVTACGIVMAATFLSMTASAWWPPLSASLGLAAPPTPDASQQTTLRGITELGFALALGVLIDTLYVRTVLVPSFVVLQDRFRRWLKAKNSPSEN